MSLLRVLPVVIGTCLSWARDGRGGIGGIIFVDILPKMGTHSGRPGKGYRKCWIFERLSRWSEIRPTPLSDSYLFHGVSIPVAKKRYGTCMHASLLGSQPRLRDDHNGLLEICTWKNREQLTNNIDADKLLYAMARSLKLKDHVCDMRGKARLKSRKGI